jgi:plasmid stabilization system protein ParE
MPEAWTNKDERQYQHIRESALERGTEERRAKKVAARTVNQQRREEGRTPNRRTQGTGNPQLPLEKRSREELYNRARQLDVPGRSGMSKDELVRAIRRKQG